MKVLFLREQFEWMGKKSGYDRICHSIKKGESQNKYYSVWRTTKREPYKGCRKILRKAFVPQKRSPFYDLRSAAADLKAIGTSLLKRPDIFHITYIENNLGKVPNWVRNFGIKSIGTAHQPASWWRFMHRYPESISSLDALIVPSRREADYFENYLPNNVYFIPHGIDTEFFKPEKKKRSLQTIGKKVSCVFSGKWLRDFETMAQIVDRVLSERPDILFEMVVPRGEHHNVSMFRIARHEQVTWHSEISDERLRAIYQQADILVLPLLDSTANNSVLEAMACGLPIISNDIGGLRDYTSDSFADLLSSGDVDGMVDSILKLAEDYDLRCKRGKAARLYAKQNFGWDKIAAMTINIYRQLMN